MKRHALVILFAMCAGATIALLLGVAVVALRRQPATHFRGIPFVDSGRSPVIVVTTQNATPDEINAAEKWKAFVGGKGKMAADAYNEKVRTFGQDVVDTVERQVAPGGEWAPGTALPVSGAGRFVVVVTLPRLIDTRAARDLAIEAYENAFGMAEKLSRVIAPRTGARGIIIGKTGVPRPGATRALAVDIAVSSQVAPGKNSMLALLDGVATVAERHPGIHPKIFPLDRDASRAARALARERTPLLTL